MDAADRQRFPATNLVLRDGRQVTLRLLAAADEDALSDFYESVPREDYRFYRCRRLDRALARQVVARADASSEVVLVATDAAAIVGYAWYQWGPDTPDKSVFGLCIRRSHQGAGVAKALMTRLLEIAREVGPPTMTLTVQLANPRAVALYQQMGFKIVREQMRGAMPDFAPEPEYYMERALAPS